MSYTITVLERHEGDDPGFWTRISSSPHWSIRGPHGYTREEAFLAASKRVAGWIADMETTEKLRAEDELWAAEVGR